MQNRVVVLLVFAVIAISFAAIFVKLSEAPAAVISMYRMLFSTVLIMPFAFKYRKELSALNLKDWTALIFAGLFLAMHFAFWFTSLEMTTVASSTLILALQPIVAMFAAFLFYKEKMNLQTLTATVISFFGILIVSWGDFNTENLTMLIGNILSFLCVLAIVIYLMIGQRAMKKLTHWIYSFIVFGFSAVFLVIYNLITEDNLIHYSSNEWILFILLAIFPSFAHVVFNYLLTLVTPTTISISVLLEPVGASILAVLILGEHLTVIQMIGGSIVLVGVYLYLFEGRRKTRKIK
ncbi:DMT family transporter [Corticicoccus populi]|uniref:DMT family transporter n=1 Tax=Corticicoccus populi TaxID=1812821 RepID=A0ABW5WT16_9STAP